MLGGTFIYFCAYSHNCKVCINTKITLREVTKKWDGDEKHGPEEVHTTTCHHGRGQDGHMVVEVLEEDGRTMTLEYAKGFRGSHDGGGQTQHTYTSHPRLNLKTN